MADSKDHVLLCPFCEFKDHDAEFLTQHVALCHPEDRTTSYATWAMTEDGAQAGGHQQEPEVILTDDNVSCPHGCGEIVSRAELSVHLDLHLAETLALDEPGGCNTTNLEDDSEDAFHDRSISVDNDSSDLQISRKLLPRDIVLQGKTIASNHEKGSPKSKYHKGREMRRLGRSELGPYAHEKQMPSWLRKLLQNGASVSRLNKLSPSGAIIKEETIENEVSQVIPVLNKLCRDDNNVQRAFLCSPNVRHVFKLRREGGFCGYRNIQMLISHIKDSQRPGHECFPGRSLPSILQLQDMIEEAWDKGYNSTGRLETGGIKGTRKYIGTPEAQALFLSLGIRCDARAFSGHEGIRAHDILLQDVASYFRSGCSVDNQAKILETDLPPIYFQHRGHSMTIVGFEINKEGSANLLVFDPMFRTSPAIQRLVGQYVKPSDPARILKAHRRGIPYLQKYRDFEVLKLSL